MAQNQQPSKEEGDEILKSVRELFVQADKNEKKARKELLELRSQRERFLGDARRTQSRAGKARTEESNARRRAEDAQRRGQNARKLGQSHLRWEAEARQLAAQAQRHSLDVRRFGDEAGRIERRALPLSEELEDRTEALEDLQKETHKWKQWLQRLGMMGIEAPRDSSAIFEDPFQSSRHDL